jgi:hypothetical protein
MYAYQKQTAFLENDLNKSCCRVVAYSFMLYSDFGRHLEEQAVKIQHCSSNDAAVLANIMLQMSR